MIVTKWGEKWFCGKSRDNITLSFKHCANREISFMSKTTILVVEALNTLEKDRVDV